MTSQYETIEGTKPTTYGVHEPRTIKRVVTPDERFDDHHDLHMMTEIGDGTFVQWTNCRRCNERVYDCKCTEGPKEPEYMKAWRDKRFAKSLDERPEPSYELLPTVITWLEERGYQVTKSVEKQLEEAKPFDPETDMGTFDLTEEEAEASDAALHDEGPVDLKTTVDQGLDDALNKVRQNTGYGERPPGNVYEVPDDGGPPLSDVSQRPTQVVDDFPDF